MIVSGSLSPDAWVANCQRVCERGVTTHGGSGVRERALEGSRKCDRAAQPAAPGAQRQSGCERCGSTTGSIPSGGQPCSESQSFGGGSTRPAHRFRGRRLVRLRWRAARTVQPICFRASRLRTAPSTRCGARPVLWASPAMVIAQWSTSALASAASSSRCSTPGPLLTVLNVPFGRGRRPPSATRSWPGAPVNLCRKVGRSRPRAEPEVPPADSARAAGSALRCRESAQTEVPQGVVSGEVPSKAVTFGFGWSAFGPLSQLRGYAGVQ